MKKGKKEKKKYINSVHHTTYLHTPTLIESPSLRRPVPRLLIANRLILSPLNQDLPYLPFERNPVCLLNSPIDRSATLIPEAYKLLDMTPFPSSYAAA